MKFERRTLSIEGINYAVRIHGKGKPLIALHGFSESAETWDLLDLPGYQIFAIDLLGHGQTDKPRAREPYRISPLLHALDLLIKALIGDQSFVLLGYSMGGRLALRYCLTYPQASVSSLILESTGPGLNSAKERDDRRKADEKLAENIMKKGPIWFADFWGNLGLFSSQKHLSESLQAQIWQRRASNSPHALANTLAGTGQGELTPVADQIDTLPYKLLYLSGDLDKKYAQLGAEVFAPCQNVQVITVPDCGHNIHLENIALYNHIVREFLTGH